LRPAHDRPPLKTTVVGDIERLRRGRDLLEIDMVATLRHDRDDASVVSRRKRADGEQFSSLQCF
jgi:hypothetical protein